MFLWTFSVISVWLWDFSVYLISMHFLFRIRCIILLFWYFDAFRLVCFFTGSLLFHWISGARFIWMQVQLWTNNGFVITMITFSFVYFHSLSCTVIFLFFYLESNFSSSIWMILLHYVTCLSHAIVKVKSNKC